MPEAEEQRNCNRPKRVTAVGGHKYVAAFAPALRHSLERKYSRRAARHKANTRHNALRATQTPTQRIKNALPCSRKSSLWRGNDEYQYIFRWRTDTICGVVLEKRLFGQIKRTDKIQYYGASVLQGAPPLSHAHRKRSKTLCSLKPKALCMATKQRVTLSVCPPSPQERGR